jgi:dipeptidyl aminopeptidase/acylaminoacyl peptidase
MPLFLKTLLAKYVGAEVQGGGIFVKSRLLAGAASFAAISVAAHAQTTHTLAEDAAAFGARPSVSMAGLSPDGSSVMYITPGPGPKTYGVISNLQTGKSTVLTSADGNPETLSWCDYSAPDRAVCRISALTHQSTSAIVGFERLISMNIDGTDGKMLGQQSSFFYTALRQTDAYILDWNNKSDGKVLMERVYVPEGGEAAISSRLSRKKSGLGVDLVDTHNLQSSTVEQPRDEASNYMTDGRGNVRIMRVDQYQGSGLTGESKYYYRTAHSRDWKTLADFVYYEDQIEPLAVDSDIDAVYVLKKKDGRRALYTIKLDGTGAENLVAENPRVDIDDVVRVGEGKRVIGYTYADQARHTVYFDPEFKALSESLSKALPNLPIVDFVDSSGDGRKLLIFAESDNDPGRYYLFDRDTKTLNEAMVAHPLLEGRTLAKQAPVTVTAPDGAKIPAYLTLPPGREAKNLPAVVLPHGGPSSRDEWGFDFLSQFLAARGYAVIQPEYRGSAGYGDQWLNENGFKNWRTSMSDIAASAKWLASQGIADPKRVAIFGWSYGGYAALMEAETDPQLYKAVIAVAPVTDLGMLKDDAKAYTGERMVADFVGAGPQIEEGSPLRHVDRIQAPVLLVHGDLDANVAFRHSQKMADALKSAGKEVEFLQYPGLDHQLRDSKVRAELLSHMAQLLDRTIGH